MIAAGAAGTVTLAGSAPVSDTRSAEREIVTHQPPVFVADPDKRELAPAFVRWADEYDVSLPLLEALTWRESRWDNSQVSSAGAIGIGQLMPSTAAFVATELIGEPLDVADPDDNIRLSARYLRFLLDRFGHHVRTALAAYVQGATSLGVDGLLPDTVAYVDEVLALRDEFTRA